MSARRILLLALVLGGCTPLVDYRGNLPDRDALDTLKPGIATKADVTASLGSPSTVATFDPNVWYYVSKHTEQTAFWDPKVVDQNVVEISFDQSGHLDTIKRFGMADAENVPITSDKTPTAGQSITILQQLFGNVGRFVGNSTQTGGR